MWDVTADWLNGGEADGAKLKANAARLISLTSRKKESAAIATAK